MTIDAKPGNRYVSFIKTRRQEMTEIKKFNRSTIFQDFANGQIFYVVLSANNICLFSSYSLVSVKNYAEWFDGK